MEIYSELKSDHKNIKAILKKLDDTTEKSGKRRLQLLKQLKEILVPHSRAEEKVLYEPLKLSDVKKADALAFEGYEEHGVVDRLAHTIETTKVNDKKWTALMSVVKENLEHHIEEEEEDLFKKAKKSFDHKDAVKMGAEFLELKATYLKELKKGSPLKQPPSHELV
jgi:hemerythrin-like domain-containing protein